MKNICIAGDGWGAISAYKAMKSERINLFLLTRDEELKKLVDNNEMLVDSFNAKNFDLIICSGYKPIINNRDLAENKFVNIHYSLLPKYRGMHSVVWAIINGEKKLGYTIHEVNENIDDGDIVYQHCIDYDCQTATEVVETFNDHVENNLANIIIKYLNGNISPIPQNKSEASWVCKRNLSDCKVGFDWSVERISRFLKALSPPYPRAYIEYEEKKLFIVEAKLVKSENLMTTGRIVNIDSDGIWIKVLDGYLVCLLSQS
ncbi:methionyl-tRNA formyltransferase, partial [Vibrio ponticus]|uniref:methionyl-tRNA formyltransferase n=1 Tax=Vibrio ponticus TaxID=265668 RepID=UPI001C0CF5A9